MAGRVLRGGSVPMIRVLAARRVQDNLRAPVADVYPTSIVYSTSIVYPNSLVAVRATRSPRCRAPPRSASLGWRLPSPPAMVVAP